MPSKLKVRKASPKIRTTKRITGGTEKKKKAQKVDHRKRRISIPSKPSVPSVIKKQFARSVVTKKKSAVGLTVKMFDIHGKSIGTVNLPKEIFGQKPNPNLLAQALRVYQANQKNHTAHTKTRADVRGGGAKPWRQKGTGRARAGSRRSPLWVGGGIVFGPRFRDVKLTLPKKMKRKALISALSDKAKSDAIKVISGIEKIQPKTKIVARLLDKLNAKNKTLFVISENNQNVKLAARNIPAVSVDLPQDLNAHEIIASNHLLISREAIAKFK